MKHVESMSATGATLATIASTAADVNAVVTALVSVLTLAWWIRLWVTGKKED